MNKVITAQMMDNLSYDAVEPPRMLGPNCLKRIKGVERLILSTNPISLGEVCGKIQENVHTLANLEAEDNCVPYKIAEKRINDALSSLNLTAIQVTQETLHKAAQGNKTSARILNYESISKIFRTIFLTVCGGFQELCIIFDPPRKRLIEFLFLELLQYENIDHENISNENITPEPYNVMFVFQSSDVDAAVYYLTKSFEDPTTELNVKTIFVQESCFDRFCKKLERQMRSYPPELMRDEVFIERYNETQEILKKLKATTIKSADETGKIVPTICHEFDLKYFPDFAPIVVMKTFRTLKEAINLAKLERCRAATIWAQNFSIGYEIVNSLNIEYFYINCFGVNSKMWRTLNILCNISGSKNAFTIIGNSGVSIENNYHFEYFLSGGVCKRIAFPFGVSFAN